MSVFSDRWRVLKLALGIAWLVAGAAKAADTEAFHGDMLSYGLPLSDLFLRWVAVTLPWLELALGICLLTGRWIGTVAWMGTLLGGVFVLMITQGILRGLDLRCGCFGRWWPGWADHPGVSLGRSVVITIGSGWLWQSGRDVATSTGKSVV